MRWFQVGVVVLSIMVMTGCPSEFGKDGRVNKATTKDTQENLLFLQGCSAQRRMEVCAPGQENSVACQRCGGPP